MNILVTGGAGYVGTELVYALEAEPAVQQIVVYDNLIRNNYNLFLGRTKLNSKKVKFVKGDILDSRKLKKEVEKADIVYHLAAKVTTPFADHNPHEFDQINNWGTAELSYLIENSNVKKLIYTSSASVYGASQSIADIGEALSPKTFYGISKMHSEQHVERLKNSSTEIFILRLGNVYGYSKSMRFDSVINKFVFEANFANRLRIFGDGNQFRSFVHIDRLSTYLKNVALTNLVPNTYNVVESTFSINQIVDELKKIFPDLEMVFVNQNMNMRSLNVAPDKRISELREISKNTLGEDLREFKESLTF